MYTNGKFVESSHNYSPNASFNALISQIDVHIFESIIKNIDKLQIYTEKQKLIMKSSECSSPVMFKAWDFFSDKDLEDIQPNIMPPFIPIVNEEEASVNHHIVGKAYQKSSFEMSYPCFGSRFSFPEILYVMLFDAMKDRVIQSIVSWQPHGRAFSVYQPELFSEMVLPRYFRHSNLSSFQKQLRIYGFRRAKKDSYRYSYFNNNFIRGLPQLVISVTRGKATRSKKIKTMSKSDFYRKYFSSTDTGHLEDLMRSVTTWNRNAILPAIQTTFVTKSKEGKMCYKRTYCFSPLKKNQPASTFEL